MAIDKTEELRMKQKTNSEEEVEDLDLGIEGSDVSPAKIVEDLLEQDRKLMEDLSNTFKGADEDFAKGLFGQEKKKKKE